MCIRESPKGIVCTYANGVRAILDFLDTPFGDRPGWIQTMGTCPVRFEGDAGKIETGDSGDIQAADEALQKELTSKGKKVVGLEVSAYASDFFDRVKTHKPKVTNYQYCPLKHTHVCGD